MSDITTNDIMLMIPARRADSYSEYQLEKIRDNINDLINQEKLQLIEQIEKGKEDLFDWASDGNYYTVEAIPLSTLQKIKKGLK